MISPLGTLGTHTNRRSLTVIVKVTVRLPHYGSSSVECRHQLLFVSILGGPLLYLMYADVAMKGVSFYCLAVH